MEKDQSIQKSYPDYFENVETRALSMTGTFSKSPRAWGLDRYLRITGINPKHGAEVILSNGNPYLDWVCGLGSNLLGYNYDKFNSAIKEQVGNGVGFSLPFFMEDIVAEKLAYMLGTTVPGWEYGKIGVRFAKTGSEAASMAIRIARAVTGRDDFLHSGYSGWSEEFIAGAPPAHGIPVGVKRNTHKFQFNDFGSVSKFSGRGLAAIMLEQGIVDPAENWYSFLRETANDTGALLILDEVVTGLRYGTGGAAERYGVEPDLIIMGKALGNGFPISAVVGRKEYFDWFKRDDPAFCSSTHWGEAVSLVAANSVLDNWNSDGVDYIWDLGRDLIDGMNWVGWKTIGHPARSLLVFENEYERAFFIQGMFARGILMNRPNFISLAHSIYDVEKTCIAASQVRDEYNSSDKDLLKEMVDDSDTLPHILFKNR